MLEGKELEGKIGEYGQYSVDAHADGIVEASIGLRLDVIAELRKLAAKTSNKLDDKLVDMVEAALRGKSEEA
jgi:hypothetical protein